MTVLCVAQDGHFVVIEVNFVDKHIHQSLPVFGIIDVSLAELVEEKANFLHAGGRVLGVFQKKLKGEFVMFFLLLRNPVSDNVNGLSALQGFQQILCGLFIFLNQFLEPPCVAVVSLSQRSTTSLAIVLILSGVRKSRNLLTTKSSMYSFPTVFLSQDLSRRLVTH